MKRFITILLLLVVAMSFSKIAFAVQPGWTKAQVISELGQPNNVMQNSTYGEVWTYNTTPKKKGFFDTLIGDTVIWNLSDTILPDFYSPAGDSILDAFSSTTSTATEQGIGSILKSKGAKTTSAVVIHFGSDGRVVGPNYSEAQTNVDSKTSTSQSSAYVPNESTHNRTSKIAPNEVVVESIDQYGHAPEGMVFTTLGSDKGHEIKYCKDVVGNQYNLVKKSDVGEMDECIPAF